MSLSAAELALFKRGIAFVKANPDALHQPEYAFVKEYLTELGARIPAKKAEPKKAEAHGHAHGPGADHGMLYAHEYLVVTRMKLILLICIDRSLARTWQRSW